MRACRIIYRRTRTRARSVRSHSVYCVTGVGGVPRRARFVSNAPGMLAVAEILATGRRLAASITVSEGALATTSKNLTIVDAEFALNAGHPQIPT